jgi:ankyrin repeat protein
LRRSRPRFSGLPLANIDSVCGSRNDHPAPQGARREHAVVENQRGADLNRGAGGSLTPLFLAAGDTDPAILKLLLAHGADPSVEDENGATPSSRAVSAGTLNGPDRPMFGGCRVEMVRAFIAHDPALRLKRLCLERRDLVGALPEV